MDELSRRLVPEEVGALVMPLVPPARGSVGGVMGRSATELRVVFTAIPRVRSRRGPRRREPGKPHADKACDVRDLRTWLRERGITVRVVHKSIDSFDKLGHTAGLSNAPSPALPDTGGGP